MDKIKTETFLMKAAQGVKIYVKRWYPSNSEVKGIVQIAHGMRESTAYYTEFCKALARAGYGVYVNDARGHGKTAGEENSLEYYKNSGYCGTDAFDLMADDLSQLTDIIKTQNPGVPVFLLGHSMGSVISRLYAGKYGEKINGLIYSGTTGPAQKARIESLIEAALKEAKVRGFKAPAIDTPKLIFADYNSRFEKTQTGFEYMSRDEKMVRLAITSPYAAVSYRCGFYVDFLNAILNIDTHENIESIPKLLPIYSVSGSMDPFGDYGKGVPQLFELYLRHGIKDATYTIYKDGRHEMLREINRKNVYKDIINWLQRHT